MIGIAQAAQRLNVDRRHLLLQAKKEARILGKRWKRHIEVACRGLIAEHRAITRVCSCDSAVSLQGSGRP